MRPLPPLFALVALLGLVPAGAAWSAPRIPAVQPPASVRAGAEYETAVPDLPAGVEEFELFLVPDDGSGRALRLTAEREAGDGPLRWRMPRVAASRARLVLRAGGRFGETESEASAPFAIEAPHAIERSELLRGADELAWHFGGDGPAEPAALLPPGAPALAAARPGIVAVEPSRDAGPAAPEPAAFEPLVTSPHRMDLPGAPSRSRRPAFVPLRN
jgi:hypothetical protein